MAADTGQRDSIGQVGRTLQRGIVSSTSRTLAGLEEKMHEAERRLRAMINPLSSAFTRWWCHSAARYILTGYGGSSVRVLVRVRERSHATSVRERSGTG